MTIGMTISTLAVDTTLIDAADVTTIDNQLLALLNNIANGSQSLEQTLFTQIATPSAPAALKNKLYFKSDNTPYIQSSSGTESALATLVEQHNIVPNSSLEVWERGVAAAPDNWTLAGAGATIAQETSTIYHGASSAKVTRVGADVTFVADIYSRFGKTYTRSKQITFSAWVWCATASIARLRINDGVTVTNSTYHAGTSAWVRLSVTATVGAAITALTVGLEVNTTNGLAYFDAATVSEGSAINNYTPDLLPFNRFPRSAQQWGRTVRQPVGAAGLTRVLNATQSYGVYYFQTTSAINDEFSFGVFLEAGTYTLSLLAGTFATSGIITWKVDGVTQGTQDWYTVGTVLDVTKTLTITVVGDGYHVIKGVMATKNASSSNYLYAITVIDIVPAAD